MGGRFLSRGDAEVWRGVVGEVVFVRGCVVQLRSIRCARSDALDVDQMHSIRCARSDVLDQTHSISW